MDAADILDQLTHAEGLPKAALQAASAQRAELVPIFLREIDSYLALESTNRAKPTPRFFIFHLLGEWREKTAYRPLTRLLRCPTHEVDAILGDGTTTTTHRVMAAVFDDDPEPLYEIILDPHADQFVRSRMCETLGMVVLRGELDRDLAGRFFRDAFMELRPQVRSFVWQRVAKHHRDARVERTPNSGQAGLRSRLHRPALDWVRWFPARSRMDYQAAGRGPISAGQ